MTENEKLDWAIVLKWDKGEWDNEPNRKEWKDSITGYTCLARRNMKQGNWCGYVALPPHHIAYEKDHNDIFRDVDVAVHGGLTYSGKCSGDICHTPEAGKDDVWWVGFDCGHYKDRVPSSCRGGIGTYRNLSYVESECLSLADQLKCL